MVLIGDYTMKCFSSESAKMFIIVWVGSEFDGLVQKLMGSSENDGIRWVSMAV